MAAGVTWRLVIASAPWIARSDHTTVIDAAGTIYVLGGDGSDFINHQDVWASTDGGAQPDSVKRGGRWVLEGVLRWY